MDQTISRDVNGQPVRARLSPFSSNISQRTEVKEKTVKE